MFCLMNILVDLQEEDRALGGSTLRYLFWKNDELGSHNAEIEDTAHSGFWLKQGKESIANHTEAPIP